MVHVVAPLLRISFCVIGDSLLAKKWSFLCFGFQYLSFTNKEGLFFGVRRGVPGDRLQKTR